MNAGMSDVDLLLLRGAEEMADAKGAGWTVLMALSMSASMAAVVEVMGRGGAEADPLHCNDSGFCAFVLAALNERIWLMDYFVSLGFDPEEKREGACMSVREACGMNEGASRDWFSGWMAARDGADMDLEVAPAAGGRGPSAGAV